MNNELLTAYDATATPLPDGVERDDLHRILDVLIASTMAYPARLAKRPSLVSKALHRQVQGGDTFRSVDRYIGSTVATDASVITLPSGHVHAASAFVSDAGQWWVHRWRAIPEGNHGRMVSLAETYALVAALVYSPPPLTLITDSTIASDGLLRWADGELPRVLNDMKHRWMVDSARRVIQTETVIVHRIPRATHPLNEGADQLARLAVAALEDEITRSAFIVRADNIARKEVRGE